MISVPASTAARMTVHGRWGATQTIFTDMSDTQTSQRAQLTWTSFGAGIQQTSTFCEMCLENDFRFALILPPGLHHEGDYCRTSKRADSAWGLDWFPTSAQAQDMTTHPVKPLSMMVQITLLFITIISCPCFIWPGSSKGRMRSLLKCSLSRQQLPGFKNSPIIQYKSIKFVSFSKECYCGFAESAAILGPTGTGQGQLDTQHDFTV